MMEFRCAGRQRRGAWTNAGGRGALQQYWLGMWCDAVDEDNLHPGKLIFPAASVSLPNPRNSVNAAALEASRGRCHSEHATCIFCVQIPVSGRTLTGSARVESGARNNEIC